MRYQMNKIIREPKKNGCIKKNNAKATENNFLRNFVVSAVFNLNLEERVAKIKAAREQQEKRKKQIKICKQHASR